MISATSPNAFIGHDGQTAAQDFRHSGRGAPPTQISHRRHRTSLMRVVLGAHPARGPGRMEQFADARPGPPIRIESQPAPRSGRSRVVTSNCISGSHLAAHGYEFRKPINLKPSTSGQCQDSQLRDALGNALPARSDLDRHRVGMTYRSPAPNYFFRIGFLQMIQSHLCQRHHSSPLVLMQARSAATVTRC